MVRLAAERTSAASLYLYVLPLPRADSLRLLQRQGAGVTLALVEHDVDEILARMRDDTESDWPERLLADIAAAPTVTLTPMELRCLLCASHGMEGAETAALTGRTLATVREQLKQARRKLAAKNTAHAVALALRAGLIV